MLLAGVSKNLKDSLQGLLNQLQELNRKLNFMKKYVKLVEIEDSYELGIQAVTEKTADNRVSQCFFPVSVHAGVHTGRY